MPASTRGVKRSEITFVLVSQYLAYGWASADLSAFPGISAADLANHLGHLKEGTMFTGYVRVIGANAPKPARVSKKIPNATLGTRNSASTFVAYDKLAAAQSAGWKMSKPSRSVRLSSPGAGKRTWTGLMVLSNTLWYAQPVDALAATPEVSGILGILRPSQITNKGRERVVRGSRSKPGICEVPLADGSGVAQLPFSTERRPNVLEAGYNIIRDEIITYTTDVVPF